MIVRNTTYALAIELDPSDIYCWVRLLHKFCHTNRTKPCYIYNSFVAASSLILIIFIMYRLVQFVDSYDPPVK